MYFNKFEDTNKLIFSQLKDTINNEQTNLITSLDDLKNKVKLYFGEESIVNESKSALQKFPVNQENFNFRKNLKK
jgi:hypothetical protein